MKILYFSQRYTTHDRLFLAELAASRHEVWFMRLDEDESPYERRPLPDGVHTVSLDMDDSEDPSSQDSIRRLVPQMRQVLDRLQPDLVHAGPVQSCAYLTALADFHPLVAMSWGSDILVDADRDESSRCVTKHTLERADALVADCMAVRDKAREFATFADSQVVLIPWGVDLRRFAPGPHSTDLRSELGWEDSFVILSNRAWEPVYDVETAVKGFAKAPSLDPRTRLLLLGEGSQAASVAECIESFGIDDAVHRPGRVSHDVLPDYYRSADLYLSASISDGSSVSLLEAMATGLPVVVTDAPGNREWVTRGDHGWLATACESEAFAQSILEAASLSKDRRAEIGRRNRSVAEARADWSSNVKHLLKAYDEIEGRRVA